MEPLALKHKERVVQLLKSHPPVSCEMAFASLFAWRESRRMQVFDIDNAVVLLARKERGLCIFGAPLGNVSLDDAVSLTEKKTGMSVIACERLPEAILAAAEPGHFEVFEDRNFFDYVYGRTALAELKGRNYHAKRNLIAQCLTEHVCTYETLSPGLIQEIRDMQERWCAVRNCGKTPGLCHEYRAIIELLDHAPDLDLRGGAIRIGGLIEAYTLGSALNDRTFAVHVEKAMSQYRGLYQVINQWFAQHELGAYEFINREQDVGSPGLRQAKESYLPDHMIKKYVVLNGIAREDYELLKTKESHCE